MKAYKTLLRDAAVELTVKKSRFIGHAAPVKTEEAALAFLNAVRQAHRTADHHCFAYVVGPNAGVMRYGDDGEPGGTAGLPMMEVLKARGVTDCAVAVTRYFGGVLLGTGGLARAYGRACAEAVAAAGVCEMRPSVRWELETTYSQWDRVQHALSPLPVRQGPPAFGAEVRFSLLCTMEDANRVMEKLLGATDGRVQRLSAEELYAAWEEPRAEET
jgi:uncharacterized YigZ family protein